MTKDISRRNKDEAPPDKPEVPGFKPVRILDVDISQPLPAIVAVDVATGRKYERALALIRLHTQPLGVVELRLDKDGLSAEDYARQIWHALRAEIIAHLHRDGWRAPTALAATGMPSAGMPPCLQERARLLANAPFVSVVVATHDRPASLAACLRSLLSLDYPTYEIIVVDNAPRSSATADFVRHTYGGVAQVRYVREDRPGGAWAHNRGLMDVKAPLVAVTDDDVVVDRHWLAALVKGFSVAENVACVTGMIFPTELETPAQVWIEQYGGFGKGFTRRVFDLGGHRRKSPLFPYAAGAFGSGANMAFRTSVLRAMGGFDPVLGAGNVARGGDDLAAFFKVITAGYTLVYEPAAIVHHRHHREYDDLRQQMYGYGVGLTAYLTKSLVDKPGLLLDVAARIPHGLVYALSPRSPKNMRKLVDYPRELTTIERKGMLYGPCAYLRGRWQTQKMTKQRGSLEGPATLSTSPTSVAQELP
jgi:GT2 family glycosyltransferase